MNPVEKVHSSYVHQRRVRVLSQLLAKQLPQGATVLDVGAGDGLMAFLIQQQRPDLKICGLDVLVRSETHVPVRAFDGKNIPEPGASFDVVMFVDVLHHTEDPMILLREARRVARRAVVIKDHAADGFLAYPTLKFMDRVGNARHGVALPHNYWPEGRWREAFSTLELVPQVWLSQLGLYPWLASMLFDRKLHFVTRLEPASVAAPTTT